MSEVFLIAPRDEGGTVYRASHDVVARLAALEREFTPRAGGPVLFENVAEGRLTPFAVRLFRKGYVSLEAGDAHGRLFDITALHDEIEGRLHKILDAAPDEAMPDDVVIPEADLPEEGAVAAMPAGMYGTDHHRPLFGVRPGDHPVEVLENILYGHTEKDDPEGSHHGEHEISDGVDKD